MFDKSSETLGIHSCINYAQLPPKDQKLDLWNVMCEMNEF